MLNKWKKPVQYKGKLRNPIRVKALPVALSSVVPFADAEIEQHDRAAFEQWWERASQTANKERFGKLLELAAFHGIKAAPDDKDLSDFFLRLSLALAIEHVPGFGVEEEKPKGRRNKWRDLWPKLVRDVETLARAREQQHGSYSAHDACRLLAKRSDWKGETAANLYKNYLSAKADPKLRIATEFIAIMQNADIDPLQGLQVMVLESVKKSSPESSA